MMATQTLSIDNYQDGQQVGVFFFLSELNTVSKRKKVVTFSLMPALALFKYLFLFVKQDLWSDKLLVFNTWIFIKGLANLCMIA